MIEAQKEMTDGRGSNMFLFIDDAESLGEQSARCVVDNGEGEAGSADELGVIFVAGWLLIKLDNQGARDFILHVLWHVLKTADYLFE